MRERRSASSYGDLLPSKLGKARLARSSDGLGQRCAIFLRGLSLAAWRFRADPCGGNENNAGQRRVSVPLRHKDRGRVVLPSTTSPRSPP